MNPIETGDDLKMVRDKLSLSQVELAKVLDVSTSSIKRQETSGSVDVLYALAIECLLRRKAMSHQTAVSPEERAERKFRERQRLRELELQHATPEERAERKFREARKLAELRAEAGLPPTGSSPGQLAIRKADNRSARIRLSENALRDKHRAHVQAVHAHLATIVDPDERWLAIYKTPASGNYHLADYLAEANKRIIADDDPLVTLPLLPME